VGFEDSFNGLRAVRSAGMTVVGLATTNPADAIKPFADIVVDDFQHLQLDDITRLVTQ
jgi:beta-phosphoglucomutase-like phosphatase (HAD superfamily)